MKADRKRKQIWEGPRDGPWPRVSVGGVLENAEREWITTNDLGAYASSTVALMHTRRHHGLLVAPVGPSRERYVLLSHLEMTLETAGRSYHLSTHQFPDVAPTPGYRYLDEYCQDPLPRWVFRFPTGKIERTVSLVRGHRATAVAFNWSGAAPARLYLRPLMPLRPENELCREHGGMLQEVILRAGEVEVQPVPRLPAVRFRHTGVFMGSPDWWRRFEYLDDRGRFHDFRDDMWSPGVFELHLMPHSTQYLVAFVGDPPRDPPADLVLQAAEHVLCQDPGSQASSSRRALSVAVESFVLSSGQGIVAGYPWHSVWSRDLLMCLPGAFLVRERTAEAATALLKLIEARVEGLVPVRLGGDGIAVPCLDATLWLIVMAERVLAATPQRDRAALEELLYPSLCEIFRALSRETSVSVLIDGGFLVSRGPRPATWMDAVIGDRPVTPRYGAAIEIQALWAKVCAVMEHLASVRADESTLIAAGEARARVSQAFSRWFWCDETSYPYDRIIGDEEGNLVVGDKAVRPNALIASAIAPDLFSAVERREILARVDECLLVDQGIRTLDPLDPAYASSAGGTIEERLAASHQGSAWPHLLLFYVRAMLLEYPGEQAELVRRIDQLLEGGRALGFVGQMVDGEPPHSWRGSPAYAAAAALLLETLVSDLGVR